jgi:hypothetical protein
VLRGEKDLLELDDVGVDEAAVVDDLALDVLGDLFLVERFFFAGAGGTVFFGERERVCFLGGFWGLLRQRAGVVKAGRGRNRREGRSLSLHTLFAASSLSLRRSAARRPLETAHLVAALDELDRHELARLLVARELHEAERAAVEVPDLCVGGDQGGRSVGRGRA